MNKREILDIFYNYIIKEAFNGKVDCYFIYNTYFFTKIPERGIELVSDNFLNDDLIVPTLVIDNCCLFEELLVEYVEKALLFYDSSNFCEEVLGNDLGNGICREKVIMTLLWSNATVGDFQDPCSFLRKRIAFFDMQDFDLYKAPRIVGYSEVLDADIMCCVKKAKFESETPYYLESFLLNSVDGERIYEFPRVYFGVCNKNAYVYAIQNSKNKFINDKFIKKIERKMYKVNDGLDVNGDTYDNYGVGNLKDITPSFLIAANIFSGLLRNFDINKLNVISILVSRWNAKILTIDSRRNLLLKKGVDNEEINLMVEDFYNKSIMLQTNLTDKFLRVFRRLEYHHSGIDILNYPMDLDSNLCMSLSDDDICNNKLLNETFNINDNNVLKR